MNIGAGPRLAAAVIEAGGFGCLGGNGYAKAPEYSTLTYAEFFDEFFSRQSKYHLWLPTVKLENSK